MTPEMQKALEKSFPANKVKKKRAQAGREMSYVSHGLITERLNEADPSWSSRTVAEHTYVDPTGRLHCEGVTIELTVGGVSRVETGGPQRQDGFTNEIKNAYSDALKRAAMRFGVALGMWETLLDAEGDEDYDNEPAPHPTNGQHARAVAADARQRFTNATDIDEKIAAGAVAIAAERVASIVDRRPQNPTTTEVVDSPIDFESTRGRRMSPQAPQTAASAPKQASPGDLITDSQIKFLWSLAREKEVREDDLKAELWQRYEKDSTKTLTKSEASAIIDWLNGAQNTATASANTAWTTVWREFRAVGINSGDIPAATDFVGFWDRANPGRVLTALREKAATMPGMPVAAGVAGNDRFTG